MSYNGNGTSVTLFNCVVESVTKGVGSTDWWTSFGECVLVLGVTAGLFVVTGAVGFISGRYCCPFRKRASRDGYDKVDNSSNASSDDEVVPDAPEGDFSINAKESKRKVGEYKSLLDEIKGKGGKDNLKKVDGVEQNDKKVSSQGGNQGGGMMNELSAAVKKGKKGLNKVSQSNVFRNKINM